MRLVSRRNKPPAEAVASLDRDERVVSWAVVVGGGAVVATPRGLWWPESGQQRLIGWQYVDKATWRDGVLSVIEAEVVDDLLLVDKPAVSVALEQPRDLPPTVRRRVESTVVQSELAPVPGGVARLVARRIPGRDGVTWWARLEHGTPDTPTLRGWLRQRLGRAADSADSAG
jgi:hypothetical protein